jgi:hypothetical protein
VDANDGSIGDDAEHDHDSQIITLAGVRTVMGKVSVLVSKPTRNAR